MIKSRDTFLDTIKAEHFFYYKCCSENIIPPASSAPHVDHMDIETDEEVDDDFEIFLTEIWNPKIYYLPRIFSNILMLL